MQRKCRSINGFTLIELSIVLVIIGLIVGGVLVGQNLIVSSEIASQAAQIASLSSAVSTFQTKYGALPGDMTSAQSAAFGVNNFGVPGNGNGAIEDATFNTVPVYMNGGESWVFFLELQDAKLIKGVNTTGIPAYSDQSTYPRLAFNGNAAMSAMTVADRLWFHLAISNGFNGWFYSSFQNYPIATPAKAYGLDKKIDDGVPSTGNVLAVPVMVGTANTINNVIPLDTTANACVTTAAATAYNLSNGTNQCRLLVRAQ